MYPQISKPLLNLKFCPKQIKQKHKGRIGSSISLKQNQCNLFILLMSALFSVMIFRKKFSKSVKSGVQICQELKLALIFVISDRYKIVSNIFLVWELWLKNGKKEKVRKIGKFCKNCYFLIFNLF